MIPYSPLQLLFFFFIYCFFGWIIESTWVSMHQKRFVNRGFMRGPFIPIYGFGAMTLLLVGTPLLKWPVLVFLAGLFAASLLEYLTGVAMEAVFKVRYWDYSDKPFNFQGHICLFTSVCWGILAVLLDYFVHRPIEALSNLLTDKELLLFVVLVAAYFIMDVSMAFKAAFDLRAVIIKMEKAKEELRIMQKRLDVMLAYANESKNELLEESKEKIEDLRDSIEDRFTRLKNAIEEMPSDISDKFRGEFVELREKFSSINKPDLSKFKNFYKRGIFTGNPTLASRKFKESLETVRRYVEKDRK